MLYQLFSTCLKYWFNPLPAALQAHSLAIGSVRKKEKWSHPSQSIKNYWNGGVNNPFPFCNSHA